MARPFKYTPAEKERMRFLAQLYAEQRETAQDLSETLRSQIKEQSFGACVNRRRCPDSCEILTELLCLEKGKCSFYTPPKGDAL